MVGPFQTVAARDEGAVASSSAGKIPRVIAFVDDLSMFIARVRFQFVSGSQIFFVWLKLARHDC